LAQSRNEEKGSKQPVTFSPWSAAGALAIVVGLILLLARLFRRHAPLFSQSLPADAVEVLGRRFIDPRQSILLVRVGARILIVGTSPNGLQSLGEVDDPVEVDLLAGLCRRGPQGGPLATSFFKLLKGEHVASLSSPKSRRAQPNPAPPIPTQPIPAQRIPAQPNQQSVPNRSEELKPGSHPYETLPEGLPQPEYELMRRLRGATTAHRVESTESIRD